MSINTHLELVTPEILKLIKSDWLGYLEDFDDFPDIMYKRMVSSVEDVVNQKCQEENVFIYALISKDEGSPKIMALIDVVYKHKTIQNHFEIKLINILTAPHFDLRLPDTPKENILTRRYVISVIASQIIINGLDLVINEGASHLKIYASNQITLESFSLGDAKSKNVLEKAEIDLNQHGNWIVFSLK